MFVVGVVVAAGLVGGGLALQHFGEADAPGDAAGLATGVVNALSNPALLEDISLPMQDGKLDAGQLLASLARKVGIDDATLERAGAMKIDLADAAQKLKLDRLAEATAGAVRVVKEKSGELRVQVDKLALRRRAAEAHDGIKGLYEEWLGRDEALAASRYGIHVVGKDGALRAPEAATLGPQAVVLVHGLDDPGMIWDTLAPRLVEQGYITCVFRYPNDQAVHASAALLAAQLVQLKQQGVQRVDLVAHSMGGLICREALTHADLYAGRGQGHADYPDVARLIMVGTPNRGSKMAQFRSLGELSDQLIQAFSGEGLLFGSILDGEGEAGDDLLPGSALLTELNARPNPQDVKLTVIAGRASPVSQGKVDDLMLQLRHSLPAEAVTSVDALAGMAGELVDGLGDGLVTLASTRLEGVEDYIIVDGNHVTMLRHTLDSSVTPPALPLILERLGDEGQGSRE